VIIPGSLPRVQALLHVLLLFLLVQGTFTHKDLREQLAPLLGKKPIGAAVMDMLAKTRGIEIAPADKKELTQAFSEMPPYAEVPGALDRLRANGFRLFTLTNNLVEVQTLMRMS
jgi:phosphoglycolate phosphatase-like HAD superfamily hydrolase